MRASCPRILDAGARVDERDDYGMTALMWAANKGALNAARVLVAHGADVNGQDSRQLKTALMWVRPDRLDLVGLLLEHGADPTIRTSSGLTAPEEALNEARRSRELRWEAAKPETAEGFEEKARFISRYERKGSGGQSPAFPS